MVRSWWWFQRSDGRYSPYSQVETDQLESGLAEGMDQVVLDVEGRVVHMQERIQRRGGGRARKVIRATWYLETTSDESQVVEPLGEDVGEKLESVLMLGEGSGGQWVVIQVDGRDEVVTRSFTLSSSASARTKVTPSRSAERSDGAERAWYFLRVDRETGEDTGRVVRGWVPPSEGVEIIPWQGAQGDLERNVQRNVLVDMGKGYVKGFVEGQEKTGQLKRWLEQPTRTSRRDLVDVYGNALQSDVQAQPKGIEGQIEGNARWFFAWGDENSFLHGRGAPLNDDDGLALELSMVRGRAEIVVKEHGGYAIKADCRSRKGVAVDGGSEGVLVRGTWFFERSNGSLYPFIESVAEQLEAGLSKGGFALGSGAGVDVGGGRMVYAREGGGFVQVSGGGSKRYVCRGWSRSAVPPPPHDIFIANRGQEVVLGQGGDEGMTLSSALGGKPGADRVESGNHEKQVEEKVATSGVEMRGSFRQHGQQRTDQMSWGLQKAVGAGVDKPWSNEEAGGRVLKVSQTLDRSGAWIECVRGGASGAAAECAARTLNSAVVARGAVEGATSEVLRRIEQLGTAIPPEFGTVAVPLMNFAGQALGFSSAVASWMVGSAGTAVAGGISTAGDAMSSLLCAGGAVLGGIKTVVSAAEAQVVFGVEGAAIMETLINTYHLEVENRFPEVTLMHISRGAVAYSALQGLAKPEWSHAGMAEALSSGGSGDSRVVEGLTDEMLGLWLRCMRLSSCSYGARYLTLMGIEDAVVGMTDDTKAMCARLGLKDEHILHTQWESEGYATPAWVLIADHYTQNVILCYRGTNATCDWLTDLRCLHVSLTEEEEEDVGGASEPIAMHSGVWTAARRCDARCKPYVAKALQDYPGWGLVLTGHSLGAGVATLVGLRWKEMGVFPSLQVLAFAAPPVISSLSLIKRMESYVTSIEQGDDFVSRWCCGTCVDVCTAAYALASVEGVVDDVINASLFGFSGKARPPPAPGTSEALEEQVKQRNRAVFDHLLSDQKNAGVLPPKMFEEKAGCYKYKITRETPSREWCNGLLKACEERMSADKLYPGGKIYWLVSTFKPGCGENVLGKPSWIDIAAGKTHVHLLEQNIENYGRMVLAKTNISDHAVTPYEMCIERMMIQRGGEAEAELRRQKFGCTEGWVASFGSLGL